MGIKERQERDRATVRRAILDAARDLFESEGYANVSIRKIAERIEYSPAALYSYFPSKDDIFFALAHEGFELLNSTAGTGGRFADTPPVTGLDELREAVWRLYQFSYDHPQYFALMFLDRDVPRVSQADECIAAARSGKNQLCALVQTCINAGEFPPTLSPEVALRLLTVGLIGMAAMRISHRVTERERPDALARDLLDVTIAGLRAGLPLRAYSFEEWPLEFAAKVPHGVAATAPTSTALPSSSSEVSSPQES